MRYDVVIIGGGNSGCAVARHFAELGKKVCMVSEGLSLSVSGSKKPYSAQNGLSAMGVAVLRGDRAVSGTLHDGKVLNVLTRNLGTDTPLEADIFVLATGKFFSRGLLSDKDHIWEPVFGADVVYDRERTRWFSPEFSQPQPFMSFGVATDAAGRVMVGGNATLNLYAVGEIVAGGFKQFDSKEVVEDNGGTE